MAIPFLNGLGHTMETIDVEFEWKPPRCDTCKIFMHNDNQCPKAAKVVGPIKASDDSKLDATLNSRVNGKTSTSQPKDNKEAYISQHKHNSKKSSPLEETWRNTNDIGSLKHDNDSEEVENVFVENATFMGGKINTKKVKVPLKKTAHYFDKDDMEFDDMGYAVEEVEHENAYWFSYDY
ncbi:hypothetical protein Tco_1069998 [Tanacetum coccineum]|uniref:Zinc knuckle CX2CX4HX4C n=1 Tax=Tanacetum coccineum TaxID=301880 RepID=A0ABQ5HK81_9ASTR